ncbi:DUF4388 domain-containing protein [Deinococcus xianganensis]|uniref:DUF4388 domain-containing protein n=1 Tax=Deinococcus xianganensis TaxID=1507289 RepID=A0A6I4YM13_9DEIO|nr:DUF4388 domain-containing protein [Deinococcus xianganensis]MXV20844.1 DUF4388 domain-containing protein [Deinococcus xianganensis]
MAERLERYVGADEQDAAAPTPPSIMVLSDTLPPLGQYLTERSAFLQTCTVTDVLSQQEAMACAQAPDLLVLQIAPHRTPTDDLLDHARRHWPRTALLAFSVDPAQDLSALREQYGELVTLDAPNLNDLHAAIRDEISQLCYGPIRGVSLPNLLQILNWERRSVAVRVGDPSAGGRLHLLRGEIVDASTFPGTATGAAVTTEEAALRLIGLPHPHLELERSYGNGIRRITTPLTTLLMEAMKRMDEDPPSADPSGLEDESDTLRRWLRPYSAVSDPPAGLAATTDHDVPPTSPLTHPEVPMSNVNELLDSAMSIDGALAAALVDYSSGMALGTAGGGMNLELAAAGNTEVVRAKLRTMDSLGIKGQIEDILITLESQYHIIYVMPQLSMFMYLVLSKDRANLAMARFKLKALAGTMTL